MEAFRSQKHMATYVIEVTEFYSEVICDLRGHIKAENGPKPDWNDNYSHFGVINRSQLYGPSVEASDYSAVGQGFDSSLWHCHCTIFRLLERHRRSSKASKGLLRLFDHNSPPYYPLIYRAIALLFIFCPGLLPCNSEMTQNCMSTL